MTKWSTPKTITKFPTRGSSGASLLTVDADRVAIHANDKTLKEVEIMVKAN